MTKVAIIGLGPVGLSLGVCLALKGFTVKGIEKDPEKVEGINQGIPPCYEPYLEELLGRVVEEGRFKAYGEDGSIVKEADTIFITVGTPVSPGGEVDLGQVERAAYLTGSAIKDVEGHPLVVVKSTVPPGTTGGLVKEILEASSQKRCGVDFSLCMNPEFLREGSAIEDALKPDRIVIGEYDHRSGDLLEALYRSFHGETIPPILRTSLVNAELIKYASNAFLACKVSFINTIANLCERLPGSDIVDVARGMGLDKRIGPHFLKAGLGYGGSCLPKDLRALTSLSEDLQSPSTLLRAIQEVNSSQPWRAIDMARIFLGDLRGKKIAILGLAFKPGTDDIREAVSLRVIKGFLEEGAKVSVYDPRAMEAARQVLGDKVTYSSSALECIEGADCCVVVTEWDEFKEMGPEKFREKMRDPVVIDGRRIYDPAIFKDKVKFGAIGRPVEIRGKSS